MPGYANCIDLVSREWSGWSCSLIHPLHLRASLDAVVRWTLPVSLTRLLRLPAKFLRDSFLVALCHGFLISLQVFPLMCAERKTCSQIIRSCTRLPSFVLHLLRLVHGVNQSAPYRFTPLPSAFLLHFRSVDVFGLGMKVCSLYSFSKPELCVLLLLGAPSIRRWNSILVADG